MDYPAKFAFVIDAVVVSTGTIYSENATVDGPPGSIKYHVNANNPVTNGWVLIEDTNPPEFRAP